MARTCLSTLVTRVSHDLCCNEDKLSTTDVVVIKILNFGQNSPNVAEIS